MAISKSGTKNTGCGSRDGTTLFEEQNGRSTRARDHAYLARNWKLESIPLQRRVKRTSDHVPLHPGWFREDLERLFGLLQTGSIRPHVAERISFDEVAEAHRRLEAGGLEGKLVLCPELPSRRDRVLP